MSSWFGSQTKRTRRTTSRRRPSNTKRASNRKASRTVRRRPSKRKPSSKKNRIIIVKGRPRTAHPKQNGPGYYYARKGSDGKIHKVTVKGRTLSPQEAKKKLSNMKRRR